MSNDAVDALLHEEHDTCLNLCTSAIKASTALYLEPPYIGLPITDYSLIPDYHHPSEPLRHGYAWDEEYRLKVLPNMKLRENNPPRTTLPHYICTSQQGLSAESMRRLLDASNYTTVSAPRMCYHFWMRPWPKYMESRWETSPGQRLPMTSFIYPLALHMGPHSAVLPYTIHPRIAVVNQDGFHPDIRYRGIVPHLDQYALPFQYILAMAQRTFHMLPRDKPRRFYVIRNMLNRVEIHDMNKLDMTVIFWADVSRENLKTADITVDWCKQPVGGTNEWLLQQLLAVHDDVVSKGISFVHSAAIHLKWPTEHNESEYIPCRCLKPEEDQ